MHVILFVLIAFLCIFHAGSLPIETNINQMFQKSNEQVNGQFIEDDMIFLTDQRTRGIARSESYIKWPNSTVPYQFTSSISLANVALIETAMRTLENVTKVNGTDCVRFRPKIVSDQYFIYIQNGSGCSATTGAFIGYSGNRTLNLFDSPGSGTCMTLGIIQHELLHILGFYHEQSRPDRDQYVRIQLQNVISGYEHNFNIYNYSQVNTLQLPYDYGSVMHYDGNSFSSNGQPTIVPLQNASAHIGQRVGLSPIDILEVQRFYGCVPTPSSTTVVSSITTAGTSTTAATTSSGTGSSTTSRTSVRTTQRNNAHHFATNYLIVFIFSLVITFIKY